ncbi:cellulase family glycosylhydrolase [Kineothrix sp. MSJ-39]|uniref:cellulase family glycosylhydrolase n=1 Tax=Kineothrix sp. MSJ-39 TaxID=2841533 RepID=UPI001C0F5254|nr:cellulase family glycosylhydrolase [Kineothrix sp. MSJ-39]MBU5429458.1 cellulase family glycosylhydrolase [Kineothrix sp. MSJ-39]
MRQLYEGFKKSVVIMGICICCLGLTACGKKDAQQTAEQETGQTQEKETVGKQAAKGADDPKNVEADTDIGNSGADAKSSTDAVSVENEKDEAAEQGIVKNGDYILARPSQNGALSVKGTQLVDEKGQAVQLRGISTHGIAWFPDFVNQDAVMQLSTDWGANLFRIAMYTDENGGYCTDGDKEKLKALVTDGVEYAKQADMYVIVDWHILHDSNPLTHKTEALQFFKEMTEKLKDEKHVLYEICNEPNSGCSWEDIKSYANEVIPVIRENAPDAVILVGTPTWSQEIDKPQNDPITDYDNIMYTLHFYAATHKEDLRNKMVSAVEAGTPVFVSEYGLCDASGNGGNDLGQAQSWIDTMDQEGISYAVWSFCNKEETSALIASSCQKTSGFTREDLSESGKWIYDMLHTEGNTGGSAGDKKNQDTESVERDSKTSAQSQQNQTQENNTGTAENANAADQHENAAAQTVKSGDLTVDAQVTGSWESEGKTFYQYQLTITNNGKETTSSWEVSLTFSDTITLSDGWNGEYQADGKKLVIRSKDYNGEIKAGEAATDVGFIISASGQVTVQ